MANVYNKLVRDGIPAHLETENVEYKSHIADEREYRDKLLTKLQEEVDEFRAEPAKAEELADILEVVYALAKTLGLTAEDIETIRRQKWAQKGGFEKKIILEETN